MLTQFFYDEASHLTHIHINWYINHIREFFFSSFYRFLFDDVLYFTAKIVSSLIINSEEAKITNSKANSNATRKKRRQIIFILWWKMNFSLAAFRVSVWREEIKKTEKFRAVNACNNQADIKWIKIICTFKINFKLEMNFMGNFHVKCFFFSAALTLPATAERAHKINDGKKKKKFIIFVFQRTIFAFLTKCLKEASSKRLSRFSSSWLACLLPPQHSPDTSHLSPLKKREKISLLVWGVDGKNMKIHIWLCDLALGINLIYVLEILRFSLSFSLPALRFILFYYAARFFLSHFRQNEVAGKEINFIFL